VLVVTRGHNGHTVKPRIAVVDRSAVSEAFRTRGNFSMRCWNCSLAAHECT